MYCIFTSVHFCMRASESLVAGMVCILMSVHFSVRESSCESCARSCMRLQISRYNIMRGTCLVPDTPNLCTRVRESRDPCPSPTKDSTLSRQRPNTTGPPQSSTIGLASATCCDFSATCYDFFARHHAKSLKKYLTEEFTHRLAKNVAQYATE